MTGQTGMHPLVESHRAQILALAARYGTARLRFGRQDFEDERTWLFDEELDGARLHLESPDSRLEFSVTR